MSESAARQCRPSPTDRSEVSFLAFGNDVSIEEEDEMERGRDDYQRDRAILNATPRAGNLSFPRMIRQEIPCLLLSALIESPSGESEAL